MSVLLSVSFMIENYQNPNCVVCPGVPDEHPCVASRLYDTLAVVAVHVATQTQSRDIRNMRAYTPGQGHRRFSVYEAKSHSVLADVRQPRPSVVRASVAIGKLPCPLLKAATRRY